MQVFITVRSYDRQINNFVTYFRYFDSKSYRMVQKKMLQ